MIAILHPGIYCSVQDQGRFGHTKIGVPQAGCADAYAAKMANALLKNHEKDALIEITFGQGKFKFTSDTYICLTGGDFSPKLNGKLIKMQSVYFIKKDSVLSFGKRVYGARVYLSVQGGIQTETVYGSRSFFDGITQQKLGKGAMLPILPIQKYADNNFSKVRVSEKHFTTIYLPCLKGPEFFKLNQEQQRKLFTPFRVSDDNNRVGYRLKESFKNNLSSILTSAVLPGTVQLTPSGKCIILLQDCQVTGGYPRILQLSEIAIARVSQKITGDKIQFILEDYS
ncbi:biotin-dependent carboxyltransferase family protein [Flavobacteriaceae bacterium]|nr:biotin-dependent carboxyltransferase family protein [Flavobacteriaceae bacterium]MDA9584427.1 biotin-dependent carboxyltransferase family protein [Flavobacteriaceae bacterium]MDB2632962.1 biotin-dependent carboxyltransferase family protein [Flavobacteriaceae bacterium]MDB4256517.1 biotin-dependent carboxyltransferase family protein [Flavobacteriaceae bacterium]MDC0331310.1 biotin-dependent carboxyltransferase family protein [Flavobacteriaceae bacterium]